MEVLSAINLFPSLSFSSLVAFAGFNWIRVRVSKTFRSGTFMKSDNGKREVACRGGRNAMPGSQEEIKTRISETWEQDLSVGIPFRSHSALCSGKPGRGDHRHF